MVTLLLLGACSGSGGDGTWSKPVPDDTAGDSTPNDTAGGDSVADSDSGQPAQEMFGRAALTLPPGALAPFGDRDGDAYTPARGDCDDADPTRHPGADDPCDAIDQDCDGATAGEGSCAELADLEAMGAGWWQAYNKGGYAGLASLGTLTVEDGSSLVILGVTSLDVGDTGEERWNYVFVGLPGIPGPGQSIVDAATAAFLPDEGLEFVPSNFHTGGDFDGDGYTDIWFTSYGCDGYTGAMFLVAGPSSGWSTDPAPTISEAASGFWTEAEPCDGTAWDFDGGTDYDGDGFDDLVVLANGDPYDPYEEYTNGSVHVVRGRADLPWGQSLADEISWTRGHDLPDANTSSVRFLPDLTGDGVNELGINTVDGIGIIAGDEIAESDGLTVGEVPEWFVEDGYDTSYAFPAGDPDVGDLDGDGVNEFVIAGGWWTEDHETHSFVDVMSAAAYSGRTLADLRRLRVEYLGTGAYNSRLGGDIDGDTHPDIVWQNLYDPANRDGWTRAGCVVPTSRLPTSGTVDPTEIDWCYDAGDGVLADLDGDGRPELIAEDTAYAPEAYGRIGRVFVLPGFDLPWDDPTRW